MSFEGVPSGLECFEQWFTTMTRCGKACDGKKAYSDRNYVGHKAIHVNLPFARSRESKHVEILGTEI